MATVELPPDWYQVNDPGVSWPYTDTGHVAAVADAFGGIANYISSAQDNKTIQYGFEDSPADVVTVSQIDMRVETKRVGAVSLDAQLNIDGQGQGVINQTLLTAWATYTFGTWQGSWNRTSLETSLVTLYTNGGGKGDTVYIATLRLFVTYTTEGRVTRNTRQTMNVAPGVGFMYNVQQRGGIYIARRRAA